jgi:hypothetical protein
MNASRFDQIVKNRAYERVNQKVVNFRAAIIAAIHELDTDIHAQFSPGSSYGGKDHGWWPSDAKKGDLGLILSNIAKGLTFDEKPSDGADYPRLKWPRILFDREVAQVEKELLATMDEMQKALASPGPLPADAQPVEITIPAS